VHQWISRAFEYVAQDTTSRADGRDGGHPAWRSQAHARSAWNAPRAPLPMSQAIRKPPLPADEPTEAHRTSALGQCLCPSACTLSATPERFRRACLRHDGSAQLRASSEMNSNARPAPRYRRRPPSRGRAASPLLVQDVHELASGRGRRRRNRRGIISERQAQRTLMPWTAQILAPRCPPEHAEQLQSGQVKEQRHTWPSQETAEHTQPAPPTLINLFRITPERTGPGSA
jgi:hypothetical protein